MKNLRFPAFLFALWGAVLTGCSVTPNNDPGDTPGGSTNCTAFACEPIVLPVTPAQAVTKMNEAREWMETAQYRSVTHGLTRALNTNTSYYYVALYLTNSGQETELKRDYVIYDILPIPYLETNAAQAAYGEQSGMLDFAPYTNAYPYYGLVTAEIYNYLLDAKTIAFKPIREVAVSELSNCEPEFVDAYYAELMDEGITNDDRYALGNSWYRTAETDYRWVPLKGGTWREGTRGSTVSNTLKGYFTFKGVAFSGTIKRSRVTVSGAGLANCLLSRDIYTDNYGYYSTVLNAYHSGLISYYYKYNVKLNLISEHADAADPDLIYYFKGITLSTTSPTVFSRNITASSSDKVHDGEMLDFYYLVSLCYEFAVSQKLIGRHVSPFQNAVDPVNLRIDASVNAGETAYNGIKVNPYEAYDYETVSHEYGHWILRQRWTANHTTAVHEWKSSRTYTFLPDGTKYTNSMENQYRMLNEGWARFFSMAFCSTYKPSLLNTSDTFLWMENNYGSPEIVLESKNDLGSGNPNNIVYTKIDNRSTGIHLYTYNRLWWFHYASLLYDLWDKNTLNPCNFNIDPYGPEKREFGTTCAVYALSMTSSFKDQYYDFYTNYTTARILNEENTLDTVSVSMSNIFEMVRQVDNDSDSPYYYWADMFRRTIASAAILGLNNQMIKVTNVLKLHGWDYFEYIDGDLKDGVFDYFDEYNGVKI